MIRKLTHTLRNELARDIYWLYALHFLNYLVPFLIISYLARVLGAEGWGVVAFALSFANLVGLVSDYGFYMSGQREASRCQRDRQALSMLFSDVIAAKLLHCSRQLILVGRWSTTTLRRTSSSFAPLPAQGQSQS